MTNLTDKLAALSEAATNPGCYDGGLSYTAFITVLTRAYRTGQLIARPDRDAAIERMAKAMHETRSTIPWDATVNQDIAYRDARAAYGAMFDGQV